jgi:cation/acetate symporter
MIYSPSPLAIGVFAFFVLIVLGLSFYLGAKAKSASGYYAAHGQIPWFVNGIAFAGDYLSAASFLGICGMIAFYGYDGFLYSIGFLAGWIVALFVVAEPLKRMGKFTFADALDSKFHSKGIKLSAAISTLVVSIFYLIPQMVGAGALIKPLLGLESYQGVILVGVIVILIVVTAGMVSTTWVQFIKGALLVLFCTVLTGMILLRGLKVNEPAGSSGGAIEDTSISQYEFRGKVLNDPDFDVLAPSGDWAKDRGKAFTRLRNRKTGEVSIWRDDTPPRAATQILTRIQFKFRGEDGISIVNGRPQGTGADQTDLQPVGHIRVLSGRNSTGPLNPFAFFMELQAADIAVSRSEKFKDERNVETTVIYNKDFKGNDLMTPGASPTFAAIRNNLYKSTGPAQTLDWKVFFSRLDILSLMLALFGGTASLPHILIRYYTVKDQASARKSTMVGIAAIGFFYVLTLFLGLGAMTSGVLDPTDSNMAAPLLARSFGELPFAIISAIAFTTVLGTVSGLILAASGAVAHDLLTSFLKMDLTDHEKVRAGKISAVVVGAIAIVLGILFKNFNVSFLVGWAFNVAASANLPSLVMLLFWKRTTKQGITWGIFAGLFSSLAWVLASGEAYKNIYGLDPTTALVPFSQPAIVTLPLGFVVLIVASLLTQPKQAAPTK